MFEEEIEETFFYDKTNIQNFNENSRETPQGSSISNSPNLREKRDNEIEKPITGRHLSSLSVKQDLPLIDYQVNNQKQLLSSETLKSQGN